MQQNPVVTVNSILALVGAFLGLLVAFGVPVTDDQKLAILEFASVGMPILFALANVIVVKRLTTPLVDPRDEDGTRLVRADTQTPTRSAQEYHSRQRGNPYSR